MLTPPLNSGDDIGDIVRTFLRQERYAFDQLPEAPILRFSHRGQRGAWFCYIHVRQDLSQIAFYSLFPSKIPHLLRPKMAEFITRANYGLIIGNFELDYNDGEVRFKTSLDVDTAPLSSALLRPLLYANLSTFDHYYPGIIQIIETDFSAEQVLKLLESTV